MTNVKNKGILKCVKCVLVFNSNLSQSATSSTKEEELRVLNIHESILVLTNIEKTITILPYCGV